MISQIIGSLAHLRSLFLALFFFAAVGAAAQEPDSASRPLSLDECVALALQYHPSLSAGQAAIDVQRARVEQALAAYYPQVDIKSAYASSTANYSSSRPPAHNWNFSDTFAAGPTLNQLIYDFGRTSNTVKINRETAAASEQDLQAARQTVVLNVRQAYYGTLQALALQRVAEETLVQNQQRLTQAQGFYQAGTRSKIDVTKAEVDLANVELALIRAKNSYQIARANLNNAMGLQEALRFAIDDHVEFVSKPIALDKILEAAYRQRPEMLQIRARQRSQEAALELARSGHYPTLSGNLSNTWRTDRFPDDPAWDLSVGASLSIPIFSGYAIQNQIVEAKAQLRNLAAQEESLRQNIRLEAEQAYLSFQEAVQRIAVAEKSLSQAKENYELASGRYQVGIGQPLEINDAEVSLANARANHINALYDFKVAQARIEKTMGIER